MSMDIWPLLGAAAPVVVWCTALGACLQQCVDFVCQVMLPRRDKFCRTLAEDVTTRRPWWNLPHPRIETYACFSSHLREAPAAGVLCVDSGFLLDGANRLFNVSPASMEGISPLPGWLVLIPKNDTTIFVFLDEPTGRIRPRIFATVQRYGIRAEWRVRPACGCEDEDDEDGGEGHESLSWRSTVAVDGGGVRL
jgi:hypothetical protein